MEFAPSPKNHEHIPVIFRDHPVYEEIRSRRSQSIQTQVSGRAYGTHPFMHLHLGRMNRDLGEFPMPWTIIGSHCQCFPGLKSENKRTVTYPITMFLTSASGHENKLRSKYAPYLSFETRAGTARRNWWCRRPISKCTSLHCCCGSKSCHRSLLTLC